MKRAHLMIMGIPGSGSTLTTALAKDIISRTRPPRDKDITSVGKMHGYSQSIPDVGICTVRDFRDGLLSIARRDTRTTDIGVLRDKVKFAWDRYWTKKDFFNIKGATQDPNVVVQRYEEYLPHGIIRLCREVIAPVLQVKLTRNDCISIERTFSLDRIKGLRRYDSQHKGLKGNITHDGQPGAWKHLFPLIGKDLLEPICEAFSPLLIEYGYEKDDSWAVSLLQK